MKLMEMFPWSKGKVCQSCGMPLSRDRQGGGTEADGKKSPMYCSNCYRNGKFVLPDINADMMLERARRILRDRGFPGFIASFLTRNIPKLERWQKPLKHIEMEKFE